MDAPSSLWSWPNVFCINKYFYASSKPWQSTSWLLMNDLLLLYTQIYKPVDIIDPLYKMKLWKFSFEIFSFSKMHFLTHWQWASSPTPTPVRYKITIIIRNVWKWRNEISSCFKNAFWCLFYLPYSKWIYKNAMLDI